MHDFHTSQNFYNILPSLEEADRLFGDRRILSNLHHILGDHKNFAITLVHRHTTLSPGEIMVGRGNITEPEEHPAEVFASSWLTTGEAFEYSANPVPHPPDELLRRIKDAIDDASIAQFSGRNILGVTYVQNEYKQGEICVETTHGRRNVIRRAKVDLDSEYRQKLRIETCWIPGPSSAAAYAVLACCMVVNGQHIDVC